MHVPLLITLLLVPIIVRQILMYLAKTNRISSYTSAKIAVIRKNDVYPSWYYPTTVLVVGLEIGIPLSAAVIVIVQIYQSSLGATLLRYLLARHAVLFNPSPELFIDGLILFIIVFSGLLFLATASVLLLPKKFLRYPNNGNKKTSLLNPVNALNFIGKFMVFVYGVGGLLIIICTPFFTAVSESGISELEFYPHHRLILFSSIKQVEVSCQVESLGRANNGYGVYVSIIAKTANKSVTILDSDSKQLPLNFIPNADITNFYQLLTTNNISIIKNGNPECADIVTHDFKANRQYQVFFN